MKHRKKVPSYWWDLEDENGPEVIVESDDPRFPVVARFPYDPNGGFEATGEIRQACINLGWDTKIGAAAEAIRKAEAYIEDLNAGRETPRSV